jgi:hypothetical protein
VAVAVPVVVVPVVAVPVAAVVVPVVAVVVPVAAVAVECNTTLRTIIHRNTHYQLSFATLTYL